MYLFDSNLCADLAFEALADSSQHYVSCGRGDRICSGDRRRHSLRS